MIKILEGQISFGGMQDALEAVARHKKIKHGVVQVTSNSCSGLIGVFCGQFITGAVLTLSGETGLGALKNLLSAKDGAFAFLDVTSEPIADLNQSLAIDLHAMLAASDFSLESVPVSDQSLVSMSSGSDSIQLIDTAHEAEPAAQPLTPERINATYQRITKLSSHLRAQMPPTVAMEHLAPTEAVESLKAEELAMQTLEMPAWEMAPPAPPPRSEEGFYESPEDYEKMRRKDNTASQAVDISSQFVGLAADEDFDAPPNATPDGELYRSLESPVHALSRKREERHSNTGNYAVIYDAAPPTDVRQKSTDEFKRLKDWKHKQRAIRIAVWTTLILGVLGVGVWQFASPPPPKPIPTVDEQPKVEPVKQEPLKTLPRRRHHHR